jgi:Uma2 family endonuclease
MSTVLPTKSEYTPEALLAMPDGKCYELVDGQLVERNVSLLSSLVGARIISMLDSFSRPNDLGWVFAQDCGYQCFPDSPRKVRKPDASFIRRDRLPLDQLEDEGYSTMPPDLVAEVVSAGDSAYDVEARVEEYLSAGVKLVWVVYPPTRTVHIYRLDGSPSKLASTDELTGEDVLPGFRCRVADLFPPTAVSTPA